VVGQQGQARQGADDEDGGKTAAPLVNPASPKTTSLDAREQNIMDENYGTEDNGEDEDVDDNARRSSSAVVSVPPVTLIQFVPVDRLREWRDKCAAGKSNELF
jgi:hypothetical protein